MCNAPGHLESYIESEVVDKLGAIKVTSRLCYLIMPRCACASEVYCNRFVSVCVCVCLSVCASSNCSNGEIQATLTGSMGFSQHYLGF